MAEDHEDAGTLREQLEEALAESKEARQELHRYKVREVLESEGFDLVKAEDLEDVKLSKVKDKAAEIQSQRQGQQEELLRKALEARGIEGEDLEDLVSGLRSRRDEEDEEVQALKRARQATGAPARPVPSVNPDKLHGYDAIRASFK